MGRMKATALVIAAALCVCCLALAACEGRNEPGDVAISDETSLLTTPAYYVFESITIDGNTITDPNQLVMDDDGGHFENWYYLSLALLDEQSGKLCTDGRIVNFTYDLADGVITLHAPTNEGIDFGYDSAKLEVGEGTLTLAEGEDVTVLRQTDDAPEPFK